MTIKMRYLCLKKAKSLWKEFHEEKEEMKIFIGLKIIVEMEFAKEKVAIIDDVMASARQSFEKGELKII